MTEIAHRELYFNLGTVTNATTSKTIDIGESLSYVNRRMYEQSHTYGIESVEALCLPNEDFITSNNMNLMVLSSAPLTWVTANAHTKAKAIWKEMQDQVLDDNPSLEPAWSQFIVFLDATHQAAGVGANLLPVDAAGNEPGAGEWDPSTMVLPDWNTANTADGFELHLLGADVGGPIGTNPLTSGGIIKMYQETRARVRETPTTEADLSESWGIRVMDLGGQESELSDIIVEEGNIPPYDRDDYVGGDGNWSIPAMRDQLYTNSFNLTSNTIGFAVPCGLLRITTNNLLDPEEDGGNCTMLVKLTIGYGNYKGVAAIPMKQ